MQYLPNTNTPAIRYSQLVPQIMTADAYYKAYQRGTIEVIGRNYLERESLIVFPSLPLKYQEAVKAVYGEPAQYIAMQPLKEMVVMDVEARAWLAKYRLPNGRPLELDRQQKFARQADWLNAIIKVLADKGTAKDTLKISVDKIWENMVKLATNDTVQHDLPTSVDRMRRKVKKYKAEGYRSLVDEWRHGNKYACKVSKPIERLVVSLYCMPHKPTLAETCVLYRQFMAGELTVVDVETGEQFDPKDYYAPRKVKTDNRTRAELAEMVPYNVELSTVGYYIKKPENQAIINLGRMRKLDYNTVYRPSVRRVAPLYSLSKITMDDIDLPFKGPDGDRVVKSYQIFDVASGAVIGVAFSKDKNVELIREALRDMFRQIIRNGWGVPWEIEMERHLTSAMNGWKDMDGNEWDDILTPGAVFPATRICLGGNAKEKRAEGFIRVKKYSLQKKREGFQGRFYAKQMTNRLNTDHAQLRQQYETIVEHELEDIRTWNHQPHPKQDRYPGKTRWQVLVECQHPKLPKYDASVVMKHVGYGVDTSIKAGRCRVQYNDYVLPSMDLIGDLHYNGQITAYFLPDEYGDVPSVHLYEDGRYLCEAWKKVGFQESILEQTAADRAIAEQQWGQQKAYDAMVREGKQELHKVAVVAADASGKTTTPTLKGDVTYPGAAIKASGKVAAIASGDVISDPVNAPESVGTGPKKGRKGAKIKVLEGGYCPKKHSKLDNETAESRALRDL